MPQSWNWQIPFSCPVWVRFRMPPTSCADRGLDQVLIAESKKKPILGICLGMQLLLERGEEVRPCKGLGFVKGSVRKIDTALKLPHIGWNAAAFPE